MNDCSSQHPLLSRALTLHRQGEYSEAETLYQQLLRASPQDAEAWHLLGVVTHQLGNNEAALGYIRKAIALSPNALIYYNNLGEIYREMGDLGQALKNHELDASSVASFRLGIEYLRKEYWEAAEIAFRQAVQLGPTFAAAHAELAKALVAQERFEEAVQSYRQALSNVGEVDAEHRVLADTLVKVKTYCEQKGQEYVRVRESGMFSAHVPKVFGEIGESEYLAEEPEYYVAAIDNASVVGGHDLILTEDGKILYDLPFHQDNDRMDFSDFAIRFYWNGRVLVDLPTQVAGEFDGAVTLCGNASFNYSHWLIEYLPRLLALEQMPEYKNYPLLVDEASIRDPHQYEALKILNTSDRPIIPIRRGEVYRCKKLVVPSALSSIPINQKEGLPIKGTDIVISKIAIDYLRSGLFDSAKAEKASPLRLYLPRKNATFRRLVNEDEVQALFEQHGFVTVFPEQLSFEEKRAIFAAADIAVGPGGSGLTNVIFMSQSARAIAFAAEEWRHAAFVSNISGHIGQRFEMILGKSIPGTHATRLHCDYILDIDVVKKAIESLE